MTDPALGPIPLFYSNRSEYRGYFFMKSEEIHNSVCPWFVLNPQEKFVFITHKRQGGDFECKRWIDSQFHEEDEDEKQEIIPRGTHLAQVTKEVLNNESFTEDH